MNHAIELSELTKTFGSTVALDRLDLAVVPGEVHGFLGPNGAGKSVTIRVLLGLLRADSGRATVLEMDPWSDAVELHRHLAYVPGEVNLWRNLSGGEVIDLMARLRGGLDPRRRAELIDRLDLDPTKKARTYSKGNRQKVALVAAFASDARLLLLDEPTSGLDPLMEAEFQQLVHEATDRGATVLLSSHILAEVEKLCDRVTIIRRGTAVESGTLTELRHMTRTSVEVTTTERVTGLESIDGIHDAAMEGERLVFEVDSARIGAALEHLGRFGIESLVSQPPTLEEMFLRHYGDEVEPDRDPGSDGRAHAAAVASDAGDEG